MIIIGELINASRKAVAEAITAEDADTIQALARNQAEGGADYIDANAGMSPEKEPAYLAWLIQNIQAVVNTPCAIDSPNPKAIQAALDVHQGIPLINSISLEKDRWDALAPIIKGTEFKVIALCMSDDGMPQTVDQRMAIADRLINALVKLNIPLSNIFVDPLVQPVSTNGTFGVEFLAAVEAIMTTYPGIHTTCGLSNISYGLPGRKFLNRTFMSMAIAKGLDSAIANPLDKAMMETITAAEALAGRDDYCMKYIKGFRSGKFDFSV